LKGWPGKRGRLALETWEMTNSFSVSLMQ